MTQTKPSVCSTMITSSFQPSIGKWIPVSKCCMHFYNKPLSFNNQRPQLHQPRRLLCTSPLVIDNNPLWTWVRVRRLNSLSSKLRIETGHFLVPVAKNLHFHFHLPWSRMMSNRQRDPQVLLMLTFDPSIPYDRNP